MRCTLCHRDNAPIHDWRNGIVLSDYPRYSSPCRFGSASNRRLIMHSPRLPLPRKMAEQDWTAPPPRGGRRGFASRIPPTANGAGVDAHSGNQPTNRFSRLGKCFFGLPPRCAEACRGQWCGACFDLSKEVARPVRGVGQSELYGDIRRQVSLTALYKLINV
jgi:hypothetical protein